MPFEFFFNQNLDFVLGCDEPFQRDSYRVPEAHFDAHRRPGYQNSAHPPMPRDIDWSHHVATDPRLQDMEFLASQQVLGYGTKRDLHSKPMSPRR